LIYIATSTTYPEEVRGLVEWKCSIVINIMELRLTEEGIRNGGCIDVKT